MRNILKTVTSVIAIAAISTLVINVSGSQASSHKGSAKLHSTNPAIDMIVTGSNKNSVKVKNPSTGKNDCGLCYHRDLINKRDDNNKQKPVQAYPVE